MSREGLTERIADDDGLPTEERSGEVERLGEIDPREIRRKEHVWPDDALEERLADVTGYTGHALANQIADERLRRSGEPRGAVRGFLHRHPVRRRRLECSRVGARIGSGDRSRRKP